AAGESQAGVQAAERQRQVVAAIGNGSGPHDSGGAGRRVEGQGVPAGRPSSDNGARVAYNGGVLPSIFRAACPAVMRVCPWRAVLFAMLVNSGRAALAGGPILPRASAASTCSCQRAYLSRALSTAIRSGTAGAEAGPIAPSASITHRRTAGFFSRSVKS